TVRPPTAYDPAPVDGAPFTDINVQLSWSPGTGAISHHVYLGNKLEDVQAGTADTDMGVVDASSFTPEPLEYERTYYWRIDEDDGISIHSGNIWKFNTAPELPIIDPRLVGWWKLDEIEGIGALDSSGYGNHGTLFGGLTWVPGQKEGGLDIDGVDGSFVNCGNSNSLNITEAITLSIWVYTIDAGNNQDDPLFTKGNSSYVLRHDADNSITFGIYDGSMYTASYPVDGSFNGSWHYLAGTYDGSELNLYIDGELQATEIHQGSIAVNTFDVSIGSDTERTWIWYNGEVDDARIYDRALTAEEIMDVMLGDTSIAANPQPGYGATVDLVQAFPLTWSPGENAVQHDIYIGTDKIAVAAADTSTIQIYQGRYDTNSYTPTADVDHNQTYYWRIDEVGADSNIAKGNIWLFTIPDYLLVEDFESYNDINTDEESSKRIYLTWIDGYDNPSVNGSTMGYPEPIFADGEHFVEVDIVHGGDQSAPVFFDNTAASYSEVTVNTNDLPVGNDWTTGSPETLSIWLYGDPNNPATEQMYIKINNEKKVVSDVDMRLADWQQIAVNLSDFNTNFGNVTTFGIGIERIGASGGSGMVFIDDIRLYLPLLQ
ncbi:MAG: LamG domain-containing protein, partial [Sedimentisphaerales bacterium]|nr:LamG domain-containing protein [Sedimentisphaerales bacterium]